MCRQQLCIANDKRYKTLKKNGFFSLLHLKYTFLLHGDFRINDFVLFQSLNDELTCIYLHIGAAMLLVVT